MYTAIVVNCKRCGIEFERTNPMGAPRLHCSDKCRKAKDYTPKPKVDKTCSQCNTAFSSSRPKQVYCSYDCRRKSQDITKSAKYYATRPETKTIICRWCEEEYVGPFGSTPYNKMHDACAVQAKQSRYRIKTVKRQSKIVSRTVMTVTKLVERDGSDCFICGDFVDLSLPRTNRFGATVEHVVPLKRGGLDVPENLRLAHWICNVRKGSKLMEELNG